MILHIVPDEKFIDFAYNEFEKVASTKFLVLSESTSKKFKYINSPNIEKISTTELLSPIFINTLQNYEFIVLHQLDHYKARLVLNAPVNIIFVWLGWGFDYYSFIAGDNRNLLLPKTKVLWVKQNFLIFLKNIIKKIIFYKTLQQKALNKIHYFAPVLPNEYELVKNSVKNFNAKYVPFSYGNLDDMLKGIHLDLEVRPNILLGNSASYTNNHIEAIEMISQFNLGDRRIITPLSYGDEKYKQYIKKYAYLQLKDNFMPLDTFMDKEEYHKLVSSCSIVIMNHIRQQALGNIITMMYLGAKIYLDSRNPIYTFLSENGAFIYDINDFVPGNSNALKTLTVIEVSINQKLLRTYWGVDAVNKKVLELVQTVRDNL